MTETKRTFILSHETARLNALDCVKKAPEGYSVTVAEPTRSSEQNAALWPLLQEFAEQAKLNVNGRDDYVSREEWKNVLRAKFARERERESGGCRQPRVVALNGELYFFADDETSTRQMGKREFSDFLEFIHAQAVELGVTLERKLYVA